MKITFSVNYLFFCVVHLHRFIYQVEAIISRELLYPHDIVETDINKPYYVRHYKQLFQPTDMSEFNSESYSETPQLPIQKKKKIKKVFRFKNNANDEQTLGNDTKEKVTKKKIKGKKKKKRSRKKSIKTFLKEKRSNFDSLGEKELKMRKPVDIIVHIKMDD